MPRPNGSSRLYLALLALLSGLLIAGLPILLTLQAKPGRDEVKELVAQSSPYNEDRAFIMSELKRLDDNQRGVLTVQAGLTERLAAIDAKLAAIQQQLDALTGSPSAPP